MRNSLIVLIAVSLFAMAAAAQDVPRGEVYLGYTYVRLNEGPTNVPSVSANGGGGQVGFNFGKWVGLIADIGAVHNGNVGGYQLDTTLTNFLFGPRISFRSGSRWTPYFQSLFGGVYGATSYQITVPAGTPIVNPLIATTTTTAVTARIGASQTAFAMAVGGGLDVKASKAISYRLIGLDYYMTRLQSFRSGNDNNQNNLRLTTGFNFTFGAQ